MRFNRELKAQSSVHIRGGQLKLDLVSVTMIGYISCLCQNDQDGTDVSKLNLLSSIELICVGRPPMPYLTNTKRLHSAFLSSTEHIPGESNQRTWAILRPSPLVNLILSFPKIHSSSSMNKDFPCKPSRFSPPVIRYRQCSIATPRSDCYIRPLLQPHPFLS